MTSQDFLDIQHNGSFSYINSAWRNLYLLVRTFKLRPRQIWLKWYYFELPWPVCSSSPKFVVTGRIRIHFFLTQNLTRTLKFKNPDPHAWKMDARFRIRIRQKIWIQNYNQYDCSKEIKVMVYKMRAILMSFMNIFLVLKRFENK